MDFYKYHGLGNDYIVIDPNKTDLELTSERIRLICHRNFGIGSDGILHGPLPGNDLALRIYNPDGTEAEKSGNGIRIFSRYLVEAGYVTGKNFLLQTAGGVVKVAVLRDDASLITVDMGTVSFHSEDIPVTGESREVIDEELNINDITHRITCLTVGNPHCVIPCDTVSEEYTRRIGPLIENHSHFPRRINVQFLKVLDRENIRIEIWERGAGYTLASGSSSCAAAAAAHRLGLVNGTVQVHMPGGDIGIAIEGSRVQMTGTVNSVCSGRFSEELWATLGK